MTGAKLRWSIILKEAYALYYSITHLSYLLRDGKFLLKTDHKNLKFIGDSANTMVVRRKLALMQYNFDIELISGAKNVWSTAGFHGVITPDGAHDNHKSPQQSSRSLRTRAMS